MRNSTLTIAAALILTGCGGGDSTESTASTPADVAEQAGCSGFHATETDELYVKEVGECKVGGSTVKIITFDDADVRDQYLEIAGSFGGLYLSGDAWLMTGPRGALEAAQSKVGGDIQ